MLTSIYVQNFILFDALSLTFEDHMSAFIGETGAGKSLLIDAISMLLGERANANYVKQGKKKALIEGVFQVEHNSYIKHRLADDGYELEENLLVLTREITTDGKSIARINQRQTTVGYLRELALLLVDIHSQHDTQYLLNSKYHLSLIDQYANTQALLLRVQAAYDLYKQAKDDLENALENEYNEDDLAFLQFQLHEIEDGNLTAEEIEDLEAQQKQMMGFEKINEHIVNAIQYLDGSQAAQELLYSACKELEGLRDFEELAARCDALYDNYYNLDEQVQQLKDYASHLEFDEALFHEIQERLFVIHRLIRKYGGTLALVEEKRSEIALKIELITHRQAYLDKQEAVVKAAEGTYRDVAEEIREVRKSKAKALEVAIMHELHDLHLPHAQFVVCFEDCISRQGIDKVTFAVSMNAGGAIKPLQQVASGGELSRLMLGLKTIFTTLQGIDTVVFDEIDTGVSGTVAMAIGKKMQKLGKQTQVFCVTHLAQVAACADTQYLVEKAQEKADTTTNIRAIYDEERIQQLALVATGSDSKSSLDAARELYQTAQCK